MATETSGASTTIANPVAASNAPVITTLLLPNFVMMLSPFNLPNVIAAENPAYPSPMISFVPCNDSPTKIALQPATQPSAIKSTMHRNEILKMDSDGNLSPDPECMI